MPAWPLDKLQNDGPCRTNILIEHPGGHFSSHLLHSHNIKPRGKVIQICEGASPFDDACSRLVRHGDGRTRPGRFVKFALSGSFPLHFVLLFWYFVCSSCCVVVDSLFLPGHLEKPSWTEKLSPLGQQQDAPLYAPWPRVEYAGEDYMHDYASRKSRYSNAYNKYPFQLSVPSCSASLITIQFHTL